MPDWQNFVMASLVGILPAAFWLWFWLKEDSQHPEPKKLLLATFFAGGLAVLPAFLLQRWLVESGLLNFSNQLLLTLVIWASIEEVLKYGAAGLVAFQRRAFDEPVDAMVYLITAALGFAAVENILFGLSSLNGWPSSFSLFWLTGQFRFVGATLLHVASSAILGGFIAISFCRRRFFERLSYALAGLATASALHAAFNYFIIGAKGNEILKIFIWLWLVVVVIILFFEIVKTIVCEDN